ncbi:hypothetical protein EV05_0450 [Prochlorococcus sp. MIT 0601]|nr:hypothetical protein EV05_0450 [Prochlorococcus sp. MIT 0601]
MLKEQNKVLKVNLFDLDQLPRNILLSTWFDVPCLIFIFAAPFTSLDIPLSGHYTF